MAKKTEVLVSLVDDISGEEFTEGEGETFLFAFDGEKYELDLNKKNSEAFRRAVKKYVDAARVVTNRRVTSNGPSEASEIRAWAAKEGKEVNDRGRIPQALVDAYRAAQK